VCENLDRVGPTKAGPYIQRVRQRKASRTSRHKNPLALERHRPSHAYAAALVACGATQTTLLHELSRSLSPANCAAKGAAGPQRHITMHPQDMATKNRTTFAFFPPLGHPIQCVASALVGRLPARRPAACPGWAREAGAPIRNYARLRATHVKIEQMPQPKTAGLAARPQRPNLPSRPSTTRPRQREPFERVGQMLALYASAQEKANVCVVILHL
jgi:hypothetical protein